MFDIHWLSAEARTIYQYFHSIFYVLLTFFLILQIIIEYFKLPLGTLSSHSHLIGRCVVASLLLLTFPDVIHLLSQLSLIRIHDQENSPSLSAILLRTR